MLDNHLRGILKAFGLKVGKVDPGRLDRRVRELVDGDAVLERVVGAILSVRREVLDRLDDLHRMVLAGVKADPVCRLLMSVPGVGPVTALAFRTAVEDPTRFAKSSLVGAHFGLTPRKYASRRDGPQRRDQSMWRPPGALTALRGGQCFANAGAALELAEALGRRGRPPARQDPRPGRRGTTVGSHHASDVGRRHAVPVVPGRCRRSSISVGKRSNQQEIRNPLRRMRPAGRGARRHRPTFCRCRLTWQLARPFGD
jgi:hypothetical protein